MAETRVLSPRLDAELIKSTVYNLHIARPAVNQIRVYSGALVGTDDGTALIKVDSDITIDGSVSGKNGLDTGTLAYDWYAVWLINNPATGEKAGLLSLSFTSPTMPSGFTLKRRVGATYRLPGYFRNFQQFDDRVVNIDDDKSLILTTSMAIRTWYVASVAGFVPQTFRTISIQGALEADDLLIRVAQDSAPGTFPTSNESYMLLNYVGTTLVVQKTNGGSQVTDTSILSDLYLSDYWLCYYANKLGSSASLVEFSIAVLGYRDTL